MPAVITETPITMTPSPANKQASFKDIKNKTLNILDKRTPEDFFTEQTVNKDNSSITKSNITSIANFTTAMSKLADKEDEKELAKRIYKPIKFTVVG
jgi:hypothetical protein